MKARQVYLAGALLSLACCRPSPELGPQVTVYDLVQQFELATILEERHLIDLGTAGARRHLGSGWSEDEVTPEGQTFVWSDGGASSLEFFLAEPRELAAVLWGVPFSFDGAPEQTVTAELNGHVVGRFVLERAGGEGRLHFEATELVAGENRLVLRYGHTFSPADVEGGDDRRQLGVAWRTIRLLELEDPVAKPAAQGEETIVLPAGARLDYYLRLPAGSHFAVEGIAANGAAGVDLTVEPDGGPVRNTRLRPSNRPRHVPLQQSAGIVRLSLAANASQPGGSVELLRPRITAVATPTIDTASRPVSRRHNLLLYVVDTLRADGLGCYGAKHSVSPNIDAFAGGATLFEDATAQSPWTRPSMVSLFTSLVPTTHGVQGRRDRLSEEAVTLAEVLREAGYATAGFASNSNVAHRFGLAQGFDTYRMMRRRSSRAGDLNRAMKNWLDGRSSTDSRPFFLYLHAVEPHAPYNPRSEYRLSEGGALDNASVDLLEELERGEVPVTPELIEELETLYAGEVASIDVAFEELLKLLRDRDLVNNTVIVFVSDHGEEFHEHGGWMHGKTLYAEQLHVPLLVRFPDLAQGRRIAAPVQHVDLLPTLLAYLGLPAPPSVEGRDLLPLLSAPEGASSAIPSADFLAAVDADGLRVWAVTAGRWRYIEREGAGEELYDRDHDPRELRNVAGDHPVLVGYFGTVLAARARSAASAPTPEQAPIDGEVAEQLRAMGYID